MQASATVGRAGVVALFAISLLIPQAATRAQSPAPAASSAMDSSLVCGNTPYCAETNDFAAVVTNFRTSELRGYKVIDAVVRFRNKTGKSLILGYAQGSGTAVDDKGNRYVVYGANGVRGIGQVYGSTFDPRFSLQPGGTGDAQFELMWYPGQQIYGFHFELNLTVNEINSYEGNQHSLGGEFPLHYERLANGVSSTPTFLAGLASGAGAGSGEGSPVPCSNGAGGTAGAIAGATGSASVQRASDKATSAVATATTAVASLKGIFGHKKSAAAQPAAQPAAQGDNPCAQAASAAPSSATAASAATPAGGAAKTTPARSGATTSATATGSVQLPAGARTASPTSAPAATPPHATIAPATVSPVKAASSKKPVTPATAKKPAPKDSIH
ncbi:MAG TPA: hypothetical protein VFW89_02890 [Gemmatimonadaceae bacterium]|nr:hypothetical protein [Gemmatimonadaceae bacterium]